MHQWDGLSASRSVGTQRAPDRVDWDKIIEQMQLTQDEFSNLTLDDIGVITDQIITAGGFIATGSNGIDYIPVIDENVDIATINVTGTPRFWWNEATDSFEMNKFLTLPGVSFTVGKHIILKPENFKLGATPPTAAIIGNFSVLQFAGTNTQEIFTSFHMPPDWSIGTDINIRVRWAPVDGGSGDVVWQITYNPVQSENNEVISGTGTTISVTDSTQSLQDELLDSGDMTITGTNLTVEDILGIRLFRDPDHNSDSYESEASFLWLEVEYTSDKLGEAI